MNKIIKIVILISNVLLLFLLPVVFDIIKTIYPFTWSEGKDLIYGMLLCSMGMASIGIDFLIILSFLDTRKE